VLTPRWRKSSHSYDREYCVEVAFARACGESGYCVEVGRCSCSGGEVKMRDSKDPDGPVLSFTPAVFERFVADVKLGRFDAAP